MTDKKTNYPDSDRTARHYDSDERDPELQDAMDTTSSGQTSLKSGKHSSVEKLAASRHEFDAVRHTVPVDGAFGGDPDHVVTGRRAGPDTNNFRCNTCGRWFNTKSEFDAHTPECQLAKSATVAGRGH